MTTTFPRLSRLIAITCTMVAGTAVHAPTAADTSQEPPSPHYAVTPLTLIPPSAQVVGINDDGQIAGTKVNNGSAVAFLRQNGGLKYFDPRKYHTGSNIRAINLNNAGWVTAICQPSGDPDDAKVILWHDPTVSILNDKFIDYLTDDPRYGSVEKRKTDKIAEADFLLPYLNNSNAMPGVHVVYATVST